MRKINRRLGVTLVDSLCGLFLISLGLSFYLATHRMINQGLANSQHKLIQSRQRYERVIQKHAE